MPPAWGMFGGRAVQPKARHSVARRNLRRHGVGHAAWPTVPRLSQLDSRWLSSPQSVAGFFDGVNDTVRVGCAPVVTVVAAGSPRRMRL